MHPDLEGLLALQEQDRLVMSTQQRLDALAPEFQRLDEQLAVAERALEAARRGIDDAQRRRNDLEGKITNFKTMQEQRRQRLEWVRGAKEAATLMAELDLTRSVLAKEEAEFMRSGDSVHEALHKAEAAEQAVLAVREAQAAEREVLRGKREEILAEQEGMLTNREAAAKNVESSLLARYERIRKGKAPLALYALHGDACGRCFTAVPTQRRVLIQRGVAIEVCEACGVLLYAAE